MITEVHVSQKPAVSFLTVMYFCVEVINKAQEFLVLGCRILIIIINAVMKSILSRPKKGLKGEIVLITGSAHGIGRQLAIETAKLGAKVVLWDINKEELQKVKDEIISNGGQASSYICDITSESEVKTKAQIVAKEVGDVTILVNNAGIFQNVPFLELDSEKIKLTLEVNTLAHFWTIRAFLPKMIENNCGHIVAMSSIAGLVGPVNHGDYSASKFAVVGMMESLYEEMRLKHSHIRFTTICPITVNTGLHHNAVTRYPWLFPIVPIEEAVREILDAIRREKLIVTVPRRALSFVKLIKLLPLTAQAEILDVLQYCRLANPVPVTSEGKKNETANGIHAS